MKKMKKYLRNVIAAIVGGLFSLLLLQLSHYIRLGAADYARVWGLTLTGTINWYFNSPFFLIAPVGGFLMSWINPQKWGWWAVGGFVSIIATWFLFAITGML